MKSVLSSFVALSVFGSVPALATGYSCGGWNAAGHYSVIDAAVIDVGDQEGEVALYLDDGSVKEYSAYYNDYLAEGTNEPRWHFVFDLNSENAMELDLNDAGTAGVLDVNSEKISVECQVHEGIGRYALRAGKAAHAYELAGSDNNRLRFKTTAQPARAIDAQARPIGGQEVREAMRTCVFMRTGAYGEHIDAAAQNELIREFETDLRKLAAEDRNELKFFRSAKLLVDADTLWDPKCSLMVEVDGAYTLSLNATMMD